MISLNNFDDEVFKISEIIFSQEGRFTIDDLMIKMSEDINKKLVRKSIEKFKNRNLINQIGQYYILNVD